MNQDERQTIANLSGTFGSVKNTLERILRLEELKTPIGYKMVALTTSATASVLHLDAPWIKIDIYNDATGATEGVYFGLNDEGRLLDAVPIKAGESETIDCRYPVIREVWLKAESGTPAVRLFGVEGIKDAALLTTW